MSKRKATILMVLVSLSMGSAAGLGGYTFLYAHGASYLSNDPAACANCHIMQEQYADWQRSSHRQVATCNDCHTPAGFPAKYIAKGINGFFHSLAFTTGNFHEPIRATPRNHLIAENACRKCHAELVSSLDGSQAASPDTSVDGSLDASHGGVVQAAEGEPVSCVRCHGAVGHPH